MGKLTHRNTPWPVTTPTQHLAPYAKETYPEYPRQCILKTTISLAYTLLSLHSKIHNQHSYEHYFMNLHNKNSISEVIKMCA